MQIVSACLTRISQEPCADWAMSSSSSEVVVSWLWHWWRRFLGQHCSIKHKAGRAILNRIIWASHCEIWDVSGFGNRWQRTMCSHTVFLCFSHLTPGIHFFLHEQLCGTYIYLPILLYTRIKIHPASSIAHVDSVCFATSLLVCIAWVLACWHNCANFKCPGWPCSPRWWSCPWFFVERDLRNYR